MGWMWTCFGGKKERLRRVQGDSRARQKIKEKSGTQVPPPNLQSLETHLKSAKEACAYEELLQPKQAVSGTPHGTKLFKRKSVRRAKSCGNSTAFENGAKRLFDKHAEGRKIGRLDLLQEEVEALRKRLAEEEEEARKLRNEVCYLRSCGVLQSPDRHRNSLTLEKESLLPKDDQGQRSWQSWLGLTLSPASRVKLEEQLRCMAADELSKVPGKGLTNGQKALIVATKLWQSQGDSSQEYLTKRELVNSSCTPDGSHCDTSGHNWPPCEEVSTSNDASNETASSDHQLHSKSQEPRFEDSIPLGEESGSRKTVELKIPPPSTSSETENFSFQNFLVARDDKVAAGHLFPPNQPKRDVPLLQRMSSCPEHTSLGSETEEMTLKRPVPAPEKVRYRTPKRSSSLHSTPEKVKYEYPKRSSSLHSTPEKVKYEYPKRSSSLHSTPEKVKYESPKRSSSLHSTSEKAKYESPKRSSSLPVTGTGSRTPEKVKYESPKRSSSLPITSTGSQTSDPPDHVQARRFIDLRYQELEEKLLKSPTKDRISLKSTPGNSPPRLNNGWQQKVVKDSEQDVSLTSADVISSEAIITLEREASSITGDVSSTSTPVMQPFFVCRSGRLWQPLSPVQEVDSGLSSIEDLERSVPQLHVSDSINSSLTSDLKSSVGTIKTGTEWEQQDGFPQHADNMGEIPDDDLFTLSPRRLHHNYNPWDDVHKPDEDVDDECKMVQHVDSGSYWTCSDEADLDDFVPILCQSPAFSPKLNSSRNKLAKEKVLKVEEYARDKYLKNMGLNVKEFLSSSDSCMSNKSAGSVQGIQDGTEILHVPNINTDSPGTGKENNDGIEILPVSLGQVLMAGPLKEASPTPKKAIIANDITLSQDFDYPVLASIENLPKWIECQGVPTTSIDSSDIQRQDTHGLETADALLTQQDARSDWSTLSCCDSDSGREAIDYEEEQHLIHQLTKDFGTFHQELKDDLPTLEFSARQDETSHRACDNLVYHEEARLRLSLHGFVYPDEHVLYLNHSMPMDDLVQEQDQDHHQNETEIMMDAPSCPGKQENLVRGVNGAACLVVSEEHQNVEFVDSEYRLTSDSQVSIGQQVEFGQGQNTLQQVEKEKMVMVNNDVRHDVRSQVQPLGYSIQIPKPRDSFSCTEDAFESPGVGGDSEVSTATSKDGDETFHDCESPTPSESNPELAHHNNYQAETNSEQRNVRTSRSDSSSEEVPRRRMMDVSPDDRPILGTVATHWGENTDPKSFREWDGLGIPNSTSKFKEYKEMVFLRPLSWSTSLSLATEGSPDVVEMFFSTSVPAEDFCAYLRDMKDQRVNWHSTPFETRLEQALAKLPTVPELCNQRNLFGGVVMM